MSMRRCCQLARAVLRWQMLLVRVQPLLALAGLRLTQRRQSRMWRRLPPHLASP